MAANSSVMLLACRITTHIENFALELKPTDRAALYRTLATRYAFRAEVIEQRINPDPED